MRTVHWWNRLAAWVVGGGWWPAWLYDMASPAFDEWVEDGWDDSWIDEVIRDAKAEAYDEGYRTAQWEHEGW